MADGATLETGDSVAPHVELDSKSALVPAPILPPSHGGAQCSGDNKETRPCNNGPCPGKQPYGIVYKTYS